MRTTLLMDHAATKMYIIVAKLPTDFCKVAGNLDIWNSEHRHSMLYYHTTHLNGRMTCLRIYSAGMSYTHSKINIAHYLWEHNRKHIGNPFILETSAIIESNILQCRSFNIGRREPICQSIHHSSNIAMETDFLQTVFIINSPLPLFQYTHCACRHNLISGIAHWHRFFLFLFSRHIKFSEHLLKRLSPLSVKQGWLIFTPHACHKEVMRMCDTYNIST